MVRDPRLEAIEETPDGQWRFYFHGLEFNARHVTDGRNVRVDFAADGGCAFTAGGVGQFVMAAVEPWPEFPELKRYLSGDGQLRLPPMRGACRRSPRSWARRPGCTRHR